MFGMTERSWICLAALSVLAWFPLRSSFAQERLAPEVLTRAKAATVFITVGDKREQRTGSGFLTIVKEGTGYIATNAHVLMEKESDPRPKEVNCFFHSGTAKEKKLVGTIASIDFKEDLALVQVKWDSFPDPIDSTKPAEVSETQTVFIIGFPFGELLASRTGGLNHTISRSSVSSIRTDGEGKVLVVQLDGGLNPGNSGGPVIDSAGKLVGVAVAKIRGSEIGFAIPGSRATTLLNPQNPRVLIEPGAYDHKSQSMQVSIELHDPLGKTRELRAWIQPHSGQFTPTRAPFTNDRSYWHDLSKSEPSHTTNGKPVVVKYEGQQSRLEIEVPTRPVGEPHALHLTIVNNEGQEESYVSQPFVARIDSFPRGWTNEAVEREWKGHAFTPIAPAPLQEIDLLGEITQVVPAAGGKYLLFVLSEPRQLVALDVARAEIVFTHDLPAAAFIAANRDELIIGPVDGAFQVWSLATFGRLQDRTWNHSGEVHGVAMGWNSSGPLLVLTKDRGALQFALLDPRTLKPIDLDAMHSRLSNGVRNTKTDLVVPTGGWFPVPSITDPRNLTIRASGWGHDYCVWEKGQLSDRMTYLTHRGRWVGIRNDYDSLLNCGLFCLNPQGTRIHSANGTRLWNYKEDPAAADEAYRADRVFESSGTISLPSYHPDWLLSINSSRSDGLLPNGGVAIARHRTDRKQIKRLPMLADLACGDVPNDPIALRASLPLTLDQCVHWFPEAAVLLTINPRTSRITYRYLPKPAGDDPLQTSAKVAMTPDELAAAERAHQQRLEEFTKKIKITWPKVRALDAAVPMPPRATTIPSQVAVPGQIRDVVAAGGGRYLLIAEQLRPVVSVFDVTQCQIVKEIPCPNDALVCGGREDVVLLAPTLARWERWSLIDMTRRGAGEISLPGKVVRAAMGAASTGPVMVVVSPPADTPPTKLKDLHCALLSPADLKPIRMAAQEVTADLRLVRPASASGEAIFVIPNEAGNAHLAAAANGKAFTCGNGPFLHLTVMSDGIIPARTTQQQKLRHAMPSADGMLLMASGKTFANYGFEACGDIYLLPTTHSRFALAIDYISSAPINAAVVIDLLTGKRVASLPKLRVFDSAEAVQGTLERTRPDKRIHLIPQAGLLVTVPQQNNCLELAPVSLSCDVPTEPIPASAPTAALPLLETTLFGKADLTRWVPAALPKASFEGQKVIPIPGPPAAATLAGSGRYLCLRFRDSTSIAIFDVCSASLVKRVEIDADAHFAGFREGLIVVSPGRRTAELIGVPEGRVLASRTSDDWTGVIAVASGHHSTGPFAVLNQASQQRQLRFYTSNLELISVTKSNLEPGARDTAHLAVQANALTIAGPAQRPRDLPQPFLRAAALGNLFGYSDEFNTSKPFFVQAPSGEQLSITAYSQNAETLTPLPDGMKIALSSGILHRNLQWSSAPGCTLPAAEPGFYLANYGYTDADAWKLHSETNNALLQELPGFGRKGMRVSDSSKDGRRKFLRIPERLHVIPSIGVMVVLPNTNDRLVFERISVELPSPAPLAQNVSGPATSPEQPIGDARHWKDLADKDVLTGAPLQKTTHMIRIRRDDGVSVSFPIKRLSAADQAAAQSLQTAN